MKNVVMFCFVFSIASLSLAQPTITVIKKTHKIKATTANGFSVDLTGTIKEAENSLPKFLKNYGKTRTGFDFTTVSSPFMGGITYEDKTLYATADGDDKKVTVWMGIDTAEWRGEDINSVLKKINKVVYEYGVHFYFDQAQKEIDESQQAFDATEKQKNRLVNQNKNLNLQLSNNEQEKIRLEKALEANALEKAVLLQKIENNNKAQDSVANAGVQIKKVLDAQKEKQKKIN